MGYDNGQINVQKPITTHSAVSEAYQPSDWQFFKANDYENIFIKLSQQCGGAGSRGAAIFCQSRSLNFR